MNKLANMRHWPERMTPNFGMGRPNMPMNALNHPKNAAQPGQPMASPQAADATILYSFNIPFASDLAGPDTEDILHATTDAVLRWTHPEDAPDDVQIHQLPIHVQNLNTLRTMCQDLTTGPLPVDAYVLSTMPKNGKGQQVATVCLSGSPELVHKSRETILNDTPISLVCSPDSTPNYPWCNLKFSSNVSRSAVLQLTLMVIWFATSMLVCSRKKLLIPSTTFQASVVLISSFSVPN